MLAGTALYIRLLVYAGLSLFIISGLYVYMVLCVVYAYNLTVGELDVCLAFPGIHHITNNALRGFGLGK